MNYIETLLERQTALAGRLTTDRETQISLTLARAVFAAPAAQADDQAAPDAAAAETEAAKQAQQERSSGTDADGAQALLQAFSALSQQSAAIGAMRQQAAERETGRTRESQSVWLSARTPQNTPAGLTGAYEQALTVAGPAAAGTARTMAEISRYFERDARRYGG